MANATLHGAIYYVYALFRHDTGEPFYIGKGKGRRSESHLSLPKSDNNRHKKAIIKLAAAAGTKIPVVLIATDLTEDRAFDIEKEFIKAIGRRANGGPLVNLTDGGEGASGCIISSETKKKMGDANRGKVRGPMPLEHRAKISESKKGRPISREHAEAIGRANKGRKRPDSEKVRISDSLKGHKVSEETREKLRVASTGKSPSQETRKKLSDAGKARELTPEFIAAFVERSRIRMESGHSPETIEKISASKKGKKHTQEHKEKVSEALRNRGPISEETSEKLSAWQRGRTRSEEDKQAMRDGHARRKARLSEIQTSI